MCQPTQTSISRRGTVFECQPPATMTRETMASTRSWLGRFLAAMLLFGCAGGEGDQLDPGPNPFLADGVDEGKEDTGYVNLRGYEVEVTIEADMIAPRWQFFDGPAELAQFAVTYLRERGEVYLEILAEDADAQNRVEWLVNGEWVSRQEAEEAGVENLRRFRMPDVNVVVLNRDANVEPGHVFQATVPLHPYSIFQDAGESCADYNSHIELSQSVYWYLWNPNRSGCSAELQQMTLTVEELMPRNPETYPEYDRLLEDNRLDIVVLFGKLDDGAVEDDYNWRNVRALSDFLVEAGFEEVQDPPLGRRFVRTVGELTETVDIYGPDLFHSVADYSRFNNWQTAVSEHEIVMYNGHSVLGSGMAFERAVYPDRYQIFQVASCLSYEYYVRPILEGKGGWEDVDVLSNVQPTYYSENLPLTSTIIARLLAGAENGGDESWQDIMEAVSRRLGHARFGVSGARDNCFTPTGSRCGVEPPPDPDTVRFESGEPVAIPDNNPTGAVSTIQVVDGPVIGRLAVELDISHTYVGDLEIRLTHGDRTVTLRDREGGGSDDIAASLDVADFAGIPSDGAWTLTVVDRANIDTGTLNHWALVITPAP